MKKTLPLSSRSTSITLNVNVLLLMVLVVSLFLASKVFFSPRPGNTQVPGRTYYVSKRGNNGDGLSWANAWNELGSIRWSVLRPGDLVLIDGGTTACPRLGQSNNSCGMVYNTALNIAASGSSGNPITLKLSSEPGRDGTVVIDGGITRWPRCSAYIREPNEAPPSSSNGSTRSTGVSFGNAQYVTLDGTKWGGIEVRNHTRYGVSFGNGKYVTARYLKVYNNTDPNNADNHAVGITQSYLSDYATLARSEVFRNGKNSTRGAGDHFTLEENYIHDQYCNHPDGFQAFVPTSNSGMPSNSGKMDTVVIRRNIFENVGLQSIFLGENSTHDSWAENVDVYDNLILNGGDMIKTKNGKTKNWTIRNNTLDGSTRWGIQWCCANPGAIAPMVVRDNVFMNLGRTTSDSHQFSTNGRTDYLNNCHYNMKAIYGQYNQSGTVTITTSATTLVNRVKNISTNSHDFDYALKTDNEAQRCRGKGASITSVAALLAQTSPGGSVTPTVVPTVSVTPVPTVTPGVSVTPAPTGLVPVQVSGLSFEAEAATGSALRAPYRTGSVSGQTALYQTVEQLNVLTTGAAAYRVTIPASGYYAVKMHVLASADASNSLLLNFDSMPTTSNTWHVSTSSGYAWRTASWLSTSTNTNTNPTYFNLTAGQHTLYVLGRERNTYIDKVEIVPVSEVTYQVESGTITAPFEQITEGTVRAVYQRTQQLDLSRTGKVQISNVRAPVTGQYILKMNVSAPALDSNSVLVNFDTAPSTPAMIWHITTTTGSGASGYQDRTVAWQGSGTADSSEFTPKVFDLTEGNHTLYIYGRERNVKINSVTLVPVTPGVLGETTEADGGLLDTVWNWVKTQLTKLTD